MYLDFLDNQLEFRQFNHYVVLLVLLFVVLLSKISVPLITPPCLLLVLNPFVPKNADWEDVEVPLMLVMNSKED